MKRLRWPLLIALVAIIAIAVLLMKQQPAPQTKVNVPVIEPAAGGIYSEALIGSLIRLNPLLDYYNPPDRDIDRLIYSSLMRFDDQGLPKTDLADSWAMSRDGLVYNFLIRSNAVWQDGQPVTSDDIIFTIDQMRADNSPLPADVRAMWKTVEVKKLDEKNLQFRLPEPFAPFVDYLDFGVLPKHIFDGMTLDQIVASPVNLQPVGSGPYRFDRLIIENGKIVGVTLSVFKEYYQEPAFIETLTFRYYPDAGAALAAYQKGDVMGISQVPDAQLSDVLRNPKLRLYTGRMPEVTMVYMNLGDPTAPFFKDPVVRRALMQGLNRQWIVDHLEGGQAIVADSPIFPGTWAYYNGIEHIGYNPASAISLLKKQGYTIPAEGGSVRKSKDGQPLAFVLMHPDDPEHTALAQTIQQNWVQLGISVTLKSVAYPDLLTALDGRQYQAALVDLNLSRSPDPDPYPFWHQSQITGGQNYAQWDDQQASEYLERARVSTDMTERAKLYKNFQVRFNQELPALLLYYPVYRYAVDAGVQGVRMGPIFDPSDRFAGITSWYLVTKRPSAATQTPAATSTAQP